MPGRERDNRKEEYQKNDLDPTQGAEALGRIFWVDVDFEGVSSFTMTLQSGVGFPRVGNPLFFVHVGCSHAFSWEGDIGNRGRPWFPEEPRSRDMEDLKHEPERQEKREYAKQ